MFSLTYISIVCLIIVIIGLRMDFPMKCIFVVGHLLLKGVFLFGDVVLVLT